MVDEDKALYLASTDADMQEIYRRVDFDWRQAVPKHIVRRWLAQYDTEHIPYAKKLLKHFRFLTTQKAQEMCKVLWQEHFKAYVINNFIAEPGLSLRDMERIFRQDFLPHILFTRSQTDPGPSSGSMLEYFFRKENKLDGRQFIDGFPARELPKRVDRSTKFIVVVDDFTGTGTQLFKFWKRALQPLKQRFPSLEIWMLLCAGLEKGIDYIHDNTPCQVRVVERLGASDQVFAPTSTVFEELSLQTAQRIFTSYGTRLWSAKHALGFNNSQLNFGFEWNPPNNTLPVIWRATEWWMPLKERS